MSESNLARLSGLGQSVWIDSLSREMLEGGELKKLMKDDAVTGVTSNPTIFQKALAEGSRYDKQLKQLLGSADDPTAIFFALAEQDVSDACDLMANVWDNGAGLRGYVSIEVDPTLAYDTEATYDQAKQLHAAIDKPNLYVKIPATRPGLPAIEDMIAAGKSINITLIFSLQRHREVMEAHIRGLERLVAGGGDPRKVASVASFFVSRVDTEADKRLDAIGTDAALALRGKLAVANAKLAYQNWQEVYSGERWQFLASKGASKQWCLWASTSTKNPDYPDTLYVDSLIGPETVNTMPLETVEAFQGHGTVELTVEQGIDEAQSLMRELEQVGVDVDDVTETLEAEGVQKFDDSFSELLDGIRAKRGELVKA
ncbi:MAG TPA: transaldolase [Gaiellaceae bacterium]|jgi:transaldolase|nr:transaldolase [Gaiellaceae bacterium]